MQERKLLLKSAREEWKSDMQSILDSPSPGRLSLLEDVRSDLQQEASQLNSEIRGLSSGQRLVSRKERVLREYSSPADSFRDPGKVMDSLLSLNRQLDGVLTSLRSGTPCSPPLLSSRYILFSHYDTSVTAPHRISHGSISSLPDLVPARQERIDSQLRDKWLGYIRKPQTGPDTSFGSSSVKGQLRQQCDWLKRFPQQSTYSSYLSQKEPLSKYSNRTPRDLRYF